MNKTIWEEKNKDRDIVLHQPLNGINKPSKLIKTIYSNSLTTKQKHTYNFFLRELLITKKSKLIIDKNLGNNEISFKLKDLQNHLGITKYVDLKKDLTKLQTTLIEIFEEDNLPTQATLLSSFTLSNRNIDNNKVIIRFDTEYTKVLKNIPTWIFLPYKELEKLKNTHSITFYELFKRQLNKYEHAASINFTEEELRTLLNIDKKQYQRPTQFKEWCIDKPLNQINTYTSLSISYERTKLSKGVYTYKFTFSQSLDLSFNDFINKFKKYCSLKDITFSYKKKRLNYKENMDKYNNVNLLLNDQDIEDRKIIQEGTQFKNNETFNSLEAEEIHLLIYDNFLDNNISFLYSLIYNNTINKEEIKVLEDIEVKQLETIQIELGLYFTREK